MASLSLSLSLGRRVCVCNHRCSNDDAEQSPRPQLTANTAVRVGHRHAGPSLIGLASSGMPANVFDSFGVVGPALAWPGGRFALVAAARGRVQKCHLP